MNLQQWQLRYHGYHILQCIHEDAQAIRHEAFWDLTQSLIKIGTCSQAIRAIRNKFYTWREGNDPPPIDCMNESLQDIIAEQQAIG